MDHEFEWRRVDSVLAPSEIKWIQQNEWTNPTSVYQRFSNMDLKKNPILNVLVKE